MHVETRFFAEAIGWSAPLPASMDSERTAVLAFGASSFAAKSERLVELRRAFPRSVLMGCSTAGEIVGQRVHDEGIVVAVIRFEGVGLRGACVPEAFPVAKF